MTPLIRIVILNYNGGALLDRCVESVCRTRWPEDRLEIVVVDNGSRDGSADRLTERDHRVRVIRSSRNLGYAGGNNLGLSGLGEAEFVALLNNDAIVDPGWLAPLVAALEDDASLGATCPKILFAPQFAEVGLETAAFRPGGLDPRALGVKVSGVRVDGIDCFDDALFARGCFGVEQGPQRERVFHWTAPQAAVWVPLPTTGATAAVRLSAERRKPVVLRSGTTAIESTVGTLPGWFELGLNGERFDVVQNSGLVMVDRGYGADRAFQSRDGDLADQEADVFGWCGCAVLLRRRYLEDVGLLDGRLFLYYEDFDLSWRGRAAGWSYRYVPDAVVRHEHAATSGVDSPLFIYQVERSRLIVHLKNAPVGYATVAVGDSLRGTARFAVRDVVRPLASAHRPYTGLVRLRTRALASVARQLPGILGERRALRARQRIPDEALLAWRERR